MERKEKGRRLNEKRRPMWPSLPFSCKGLELQASAELNSATSYSYAIDLL